MRDERQCEEDDDAGEGEEEQRREHARDVEAVARFDDAIGKARARAGRTGGDFCNHRADQREPARDLQAAEDIGQRRRQLEVEEHLQPCRPIEAEKIDEVVVDRIEPERGVGEHGKEGDDPGAGEHRRRLRQINEQERRDCHDRRHLQDDRIGIERIFDEPRLIEQDGKADAADGGEQKTFERRGQRDEKGGQQHRAVGDQRGENEPRARQHVGRNIAGAHHHLPQQHTEREHRDRQQHAQHAIRAG